MAGDQQCEKGQGAPGPCPVLADVLVMRSPPGVRRAQKGSLQFHTRRCTSLCRRFGLQAPSQLTLPSPKGRCIHGNQELGVRDTSCPAAETRVGEGANQRTLPSGISNTATVVNVAARDLGVGLTLPTTQEGHDLLPTEREPFPRSLARATGLLETVMLSRCLMGLRGHRTAVWFSKKSVSRWTQQLAPTPEDLRASVGITEPEAAFFPGDSWTHSSSRSTGLKRALPMPTKTR
ncbi:uncharacterized protein LOC115280950 [Suricata suricatta]|uniref:uncharacterized protein LOC115280950 n=1 Tax=Suricata suricatta TaxID=37032 RepID=UPI001155D4E2|nr:uncharacterized protein LOC115280950 [Suricata suricatta]